MDNQVEQPIGTTQPAPEVKSSSKKVLLGVIAASILLFGVIIIYALSTQSTNTSKTNSYKNYQSLSPTPSSVTSTTDTQLDKDTQNIDSNINSLDSDVNSVNQGLNDKPVDLSQ